MAVKVRLAVIPSANEALRDLGTVAFVALHLLSAGRHHSSAAAVLLRLIERLEDLHNKVQGMISSPNFTLPRLIFDVSRRCSQYLNRCMTVLAS